MFHRVYRLSAFAALSLLAGCGGDARVVVDDPDADNPQAQAADAQMQDMLRQSREQMMQQMRRRPTPEETVPQPQ